jgi:hypothetical protein
VGHFRFKDDIALIPNACRYQIEVRDTESTLQIISAVMDDTGWYQCDASNASGTTSLRGRVAVVPTQGVSTASVGGEQQPYHSVHYQHRHQAMTEVQQQQIVPYVNPRAHQQLNFSQQPPLPPPVRPQFTRHIQHQQLYEGQPCRLLAQYTPTVDPTLSVEWLFNGRAIAASMRLRRVPGFDVYTGSRIAAESDFGQAVLQINPVGVHDTGVYACVLRNAIGEARSTADMRVLGE